MSSVTYIIFVATVMPSKEIIWYRLTTFSGIINFYVNFNFLKLENQSHEIYFWLLFNDFKNGNKYKMVIGLTFLQADMIWKNNNINISNEELQTLNFKRRLHIKTTLWIFFEDLYIKVNMCFITYLKKWIHSNHIGIQWRYIYYM